MEVIICSVPGTVGSEGLLQHNDRVIMINFTVREFFWCVSEIIQQAERRLTFKLRTKSPRWSLSVFCVDLIIGKLSFYQKL